LKTWIKDIVDRRGVGGFVKQLHLMSRYHGFFRKNFPSSLHRFLCAVEKYDAHCTFPIVAHVAVRNRKVVSKIVDGGHEIASHGLIHVRFDYLSYTEQFRMFKESVEILKALTLTDKIVGVRTPYQVHNDDTFVACADLGFQYDSSTHISKPTKPRLLHPKMVEIPVVLSDPTLIDEKGTPPNELSKIWIKVLEECGHNEVVTLNAHPVRMGTERYVTVLEELLRYARNNGFWIACLSEVATKFRSRGINMPTLALSGDIDCVSIWDYTRRLLRKA